MIEELECKILRELISNPQDSFSNIAKKLNISQNTVKKRYEKMIAEKTIIRTFLTIDLSKIGFQGKARFTIRTHQKTQTIEALKKIPNIVLVAETFGDYDVIAIAAVKDLTSMIKIDNEVKKIPSILQADVTLEKATYFPVSEQFNFLVL